MPMRTLAMAELDSRVAKTTMATPIRIFDMAPSAPSPVTSVSLDFFR
jgi:hypothetical protein